MPGLWKAWKAKGRLPTLSTSPLEISPKGGEIFTFPQLGRSGLEKWKTKSRFPTFPSHFASMTPVRCQCRDKTPAILLTLPIRAAVSLGGDAVDTLQ